MDWKQDKKLMPKPAASKVLTLTQAARWANAQHRKRKRIVATNGCFDLLHFGHVTYLQQAKQLGDVLVVGLNGDDSVRQLKGAGRPLVSANYRAGVLAALECVDAVVIFPQKRAHRFLATVRPDLYVKGGDYRPETFDARERAVLTSLGTKIKVLPFVPGVSTTSLIEKIRRL
jgi:rfaE bifunctional protein nucleotidyltransferase chain/domain